MNMSASFEDSFRIKPTLKAQLDQGRGRIDPYKVQEKRRASIHKINKRFNDTFEQIEDETQTFQITVNIGGQEKQIVAYMDEDPEDIAIKFIKDQDIDVNLKETLTNLISDQMNKLTDQR